MVIRHMSHGQQRASSLGAASENELAESVIRLFR
jgi:hypothetical protein